jgi:hypothetical protein
MNPPRWLEATLCLLLKPGDRESVSGDVLEEYREIVRPAMSRWRADLWYAAQVAGFLWRASWRWGVLLGGALSMRYVLDAASPIVDPQRAVVLSQAVVVILLLGSFLGARRTALIRTGILVALAAGLTGGIISIVAMAGILAVRHDARFLMYIRSTGGIEEPLIGIPLIVLALGAILGTVGGTLGKAAAGISRLARRRV